MKPFNPCWMRVAGMFALLISVNATEPVALTEPQTLGSIDRKDPRIDKLIPADAKLEILAKGFDWSEGPVWRKEGAGGFLLFSDVPQATIFKWQQGKDLSVFLKPSGYTGERPEGSEPGSNGLTLDAQGRLIICQHGARRIARLDDQQNQTVVVDRFEGKRFNSPNDLTYDSKGNLFFTDPPYGLAGKNESPLKEIPFNGVYRLSADGKLTLLSKELTYPNGIALSPDEKTLYVANSDPKSPAWYAFDVASDGTVSNKRLFFDAQPLRGPGIKGSTDGLKVDVDGNLFATGPGGVHIFAPDGTHLGLVRTGEANGNCAWGEDGSVLYVNVDMYLCRIKTTTRGKMPGGQ